MRAHATVTALPAPGGAVTAGPSELLLHVHAELVPLRLVVRSGPADAAGPPPGPPVEPGPATAGPSTSIGGDEAFVTVLDTTLELPSGRIVLDTSAGAQFSLEGFSVPAGTCHVRVQTRGGAAARRIEDAHLDADTDELIEQVGPEEWTIDLYH